MTDRVYNVLFLCTGNSARSILAEALLRHWGRGRFRAFSAGSQPRGEVNPFALEQLKAVHLPVDGLRSKSWTEFSQFGAPQMDFVVTVCDQAAAEVCPIWPGQPMTAHWGIPDPAAAAGSDETKRQAFRAAYRTLDTRIKLFTSLQPEKLGRLALEREVQGIGTAGAQPG